MPEEADPRRNVVFVVGAPRSGTSWLNWMLTDHPAIVGGPETNFFTLGFGELLRKYEQGRKREWVHSGMHHYLEPEAFRDAVRAFWDTVFEKTIAEKPAATVLVEKTPKHGSCIPEILQLFPRARFIHCYRRSEDSVASLLRATATWAKGTGPRKTLKAAKLWRRRVAEIEEGLAGLEASRWTRVRYENLKSGTAAELARVFDWIGVSQDETMCASIVADNSLAKTMKKLDDAGFSEFARPNTDQPAPLGSLQKSVIRAVTRRQEEALLKADHQELQT